MATKIVLTKKSNPKEKIILRKKVNPPRSRGGRYA